MPAERINIKLTKELAEQIDAFIERHPELALKNQRNTAVIYILRRWLEQDMQPTLSEQHLEEDPRED